MYKVRVAASGQKIAVYQNDKLLKVIQASDETFKPAEAVKYAEELNKELQKSAEQMQDPDGIITTPTKAEQQISDLPKTQQQATGVGGADIMAIQAKLHEAQQKIQALHTENCYLKESSTVERKARRGLAIAKHEASLNVIASTESAIENRVMEITAMSDEDIALLERKTAGLSEFESAQHAQKYATAMKVKSRIYRQAAEEAMEDGSEEEAIKQESKAAHCEKRASQAEDFAKQAELGDVDDNDEAMNLEMGTSNQFQASSDPDNDDDDDSSPETDTDDDMDKMSSKKINLGKKLASLYAQAAKMLSKIAEEADDEDEDEVVEEAKKEARLARKNASILRTASDDDEDEDDEDFEPTASLSDIYKKIASTLIKIAEEAEDEGDDDTAEEAYKEAKVARKKASILINASDDEDEDDEEDNDDDDEMTSTAKNLASLYRNAAKQLSKIAEDAEENNEEEVSKEARREARLARKNASILHSASDDEDEDDDEDFTPTAKSLASTYIKISKQLSKIAEDADDDEVVEEAQEEAKTAMKKAKVLAKFANDDFDMDDEFDPKDIVEHVQEDAEGDAPNMNYSAELTKLYTKIAEQHKSIAKQAEEEGNEEVAQEATAEAEDAEKKASIFQNATAKKQATSESLINLYEKVASYLEKIAEDAEVNNQEQVADEADQEAKSARSKANILRTASDDEDADDEDMDMSDTGETKTASDDTESEDDDFSTEDDGEEKTASKIASITTHSKGVDKIASVEVNQAAFDPSVESLSSQLWGKKTAE